MGNGTSRLHLSHTILIATAFALLLTLVPVFAWHIYSQRSQIEETATEHGFDVEKYREFVEQGEEKDRLRHNMLERRTYDFLISRAAVTADEG